MFLTKFTKIATEDMDTPVVDTDPAPVEDVEPVDTELAEFVDEAPVEDADPALVVPEEELPEDDVVVDDLDEEIHGVESLGDEIEHLTNLAGAIEQYGISPGMMLVADREGLLASTFISIPATESMAGAYRPESQTSTAALEGVMSAIKSKTSEWAAKAGSAVKSLATKGASIIAGAVNWVTGVGKSIASKAWNATKATGTKIKAHPYKTIIVVISAIAACAAVFAVCAAFPAAPAAVAAWFSRVKTAVTSIKWPFGKIAVANAGGNLTITTSAASTAEASTALVTTSNMAGYTAKSTLSGALAALKAALTKVGGSLTSFAKSAGHAVYIGWNVVTAPAQAVGAVAGVAVGGTSALAASALGASAKGSKIVGTILGGITFTKVYWFCMKLTWKLVRMVVMPAVNMVKSAISAVSGAVFGGKAEPAAA